MKFSSKYQCNIKLCSIVFLLTLFLCVSINIAIAENNDSVAKDIIKKSRSIHVPDTGYEMTVIQKIDDISSKTLRLNTSNTVSYKAQFLPRIGLKKIKTTETLINLKNQSQMPQQPTVLVDLKIFIDQMLSYSELNLTETQLEKRSVFQIEGESLEAISKCILFIDKETFQVLRIETFIHGKHFADVDLKYGSPENGYYFPQRVLIYHYMDKSKVQIEFFNYNLLN